MPRKPDPNDEKTKREDAQRDDTNRPPRGSQKEKNENGYTEDAKNSDGPQV